MKSLGHQPLGRFDRGDGIGQQRFLVGQHFELHPIGAGISKPEQQLAAQSSHAHGVVGREAAGRVGQQRVAIAVDRVEQIAALAVEQPLAADRHGNAIGARERERLGHQFVAGVFAGADDQAAVERVAADPQRRIHWPHRHELRRR